MIKGVLKSFKSALHVADNELLRSGSGAGVLVVTQELVSDCQLATGLYGLWLRCPHSDLGLRTMLVTHQPSHRRRQSCHVWLTWMRQPGEFWDFSDIIELFHMISLPVHADGKPRIIL